MDCHGLRPRNDRFGLFSGRLWLAPTGLCRVIERTECCTLSGRFLRRLQGFFQIVEQIVRVF